MRPFIDRLRFPRALRFSVIAACGAVLLTALASCGGDPEGSPAGSPKRDAKRDAKGAAEGAPEWMATVRRSHDAGADRFRFFRGGGFELLVEETSGWNADRQAALILEAFAAVRRSFETDLDLVVPGLDTTRPVRAVVAGSSDSYDRVAGRRDDLDLAARYARRVRYLPEHDCAVFDRDFETSAVAAYAAWSLVLRFRSASPDADRTRTFVEEALYGRYLGVVRSCATDEHVGAWNYDFGRIDMRWFNRIRGHAQGYLADAWPGSWPKVTGLSAALQNLPKMDPDGRTILRSLIWLLDAFLRDFAVDDDGFVRFDRPGEYRDVWRTIVRTNLQVGLPPLDLPRALVEAGVDVPQLEAHFAAWLDWASRKIAMRHFAQGRLIPWDQFRNRRDQATGDREDDRLATKR